MTALTYEPPLSRLRCAAERVILLNDADDVSGSLLMNLISRQEMRLPVRNPHRLTAIETAGHRILQHTAVGETTGTLFLAALQQALASNDDTNQFAAILGEDLEPEQFREPPSRFRRFVQWLMPHHSRRREHEPLNTTLLTNGNSW
jgi:hypothetical protein